MVFWEKYRTIILLFLGAFLLRFLFLLPTLIATPLFPATISYDGYYEMAHNLLQGNGFSRSASVPVVPDSVRMPLYPLIIAGVVTLTGSYKIFLVFQILVASFIPLIGKKIAFQLTQHPKIALITGILLAIEPFSIWLSGVMLTETLFAFFFLLSVVFFLEYLRSTQTLTLMWLTVFLAIATLIKPTTQFFPLILICTIFLKRELRFRIKFQHSLLLLALFWVIFTPWLYRNHLVFNNASLVVQPVSNLYAYLVPTTIALEKNISFQKAQSEFLMQENVESIENINLGNAGIFKERAVAELKKHPLGFLESLMVTGYAFFLHDGYRTVLEWYDLFYISSEKNITSGQILRTPSLLIDIMSPSLLAILGAKIGWLVITLVALCGFYLWIKSRPQRHIAIFIFLTVGYFCATSAVIGLAINARFRNPINAIIFIFALYGTMILLRKIKEKKSKNGTAITSRWQ